MRIFGLFLAACILCALPQNRTVRSQNIPQQADHWEAAALPLMSPWADDVSPKRVWPEYPRPQMTRDAWKNLNGLWDFGITSVESKKPSTWQGRILVPFAVESALSGVKRRVGPDGLLWYRRSFNVPEAWAEKRVLLHFEAVDWDVTVMVNGEKVGTHRGGYDAFTFDITDALQSTGKQSLVVRVWDPTDAGNQPRGKQVRDPRGIWYTPVTGIWQTVWLEPVPAASISRLKMTPDINRDKLHLAVQGRGALRGHTVEAVALADGKEVGRAHAPFGDEITVPVPDAHLWSPKDPFLYDLRVRLLRDGRAVDSVKSYFGMRSIAIGRDEKGTPRILLNGEFVFQLGPLDQGYWPGGLYTAPTDEALRYDVMMTKKLGYNMSRKHVKVAPKRWYYWTDSLGLLVWQDMPSGDNETAKSKRQFRKEFGRMINGLYNHPSIIGWVAFNEGWGQFATEQTVAFASKMDSSRLIIDASGWQHRGAGDIIDVHRYQGPTAVHPEPERASIEGEFGGLGYVVKDHTWADEGWGYEGTYDTKKQLTDRYVKLISRMWHLKDRAGMSGGIYTQLTDLEAELNGLMTYDRAVLKMDTSRVSSVNKGITPFILPEQRRFIESAAIRLFNGAEETDIRYTLDGSTPIDSSTLYVRPFTIEESVTVKAQAFNGPDGIGPVVTADFKSVAGREAEALDMSQLEQGLHYEYFEGAARHRDRFAQHWPLRQHVARGDVLEPIKAGILAEFSLHPRERDELFGITYKGYLEIPRDGVYTFYLESDDDVKMLIGGTQVTPRAGQSPWTTVDCISVPLQSGLHPIELRYFQAYGPSNLAVYFEGPKLDKQRIPASALYHEAGNASGR